VPSDAAPIPESGFNGSNDDAVEEAVKTTESSIDIEDEIKSSFNKDGKTELYEEYSNHDNEGNLRNPDMARKRMREKHHVRIKEEPLREERRVETEVSILEPQNPQTRAYLENLYAGKCQICDDTFSQRDGTPFFVATHIIERKKARFLDEPSNALCLCPLHFAQWRHASKECPDIVEKIKNGTLHISIKLCGKELSLRYKEKHLADLQELLNAHEGDYPLSKHQEG
jgi:hypothetical protein